MAINSTAPRCIRYFDMVYWMHFDVQRYNTHSIDISNVETSAMGPCSHLDMMDDRSEYYASEMLMYKITNN